ncbi:DUF881 domain-containing protein [Thermosyntropha sp.]|uniref:DUF881 domain-containing protein n=1 Tax=Thermosyntropha sp. TaxID=2740820 RepID=UPI0025D26E82|nr:DUF881 domain-containing protein [Thermosyntropha sp.]MBO8159326.1 DUF881 domain-containing protein [Thermosyntropha sp.]
MEKKSTFISIAAVCLVLGMMLAIQFKTTQSYQQATLPARINELSQQLNTVTEERDALAEEVLILREKLKNSRDYDQAMLDLQEELQRASMAACMLPVEGPGIIVILDDSKRILQPGENPNNLLIHDIDILMLINELKASGAEAISINGERITAMTEIRCAGTMILVNWNKISPPFEIRAIGNPDMLESGLMIRGGIVEMLKVGGMQVNIQKMEKISIPAYNGKLKFKYSTPVEYKEEKAE